MKTTPQEQIVTREVRIKGWGRPDRIGAVRYDRDRKPFRYRSQTTPYAVWLYLDQPRHMIGRIQLSEAELTRFMQYVDRSGGDDACWRWKGSHWGKGLQYPAFGFRRRVLSAHRVAYEHFVGPIPEGKQIDHVWANGCRFKDCVNWLRHLEPVTCLENVRRGTGPNTAHATRTHCKNGHPLEGDNLIPAFLRRGMRKCRACTQAWHLARSGIHVYPIEERKQCGCCPAMTRGHCTRCARPLCSKCRWFDGQQPVCPTRALEDCTQGAANRPQTESK